MGMCLFSPLFCITHSHVPGRRLEQPSEAAFYGLPVEPIYTLGMDVPQAWLVRPREAMYDLDNIQLSALSPEDTVKGVQALFDLDFLVVEGHARHSDANAPPRGVQLQLTNGNGTSIDDTQIVATLGYLQFKATPGVFQLEIREGRGRDIFELESAGNEGWESPPVADVGSEITVTNFEGLTLYPRLIRRPGMEHEDVLMEIQDAEEAPGLFEGIFSRLVGSYLGCEVTHMAAVSSRCSAPRTRTWLPLAVLKRTSIFSLLLRGCYTRRV